VPKEKKRIQDQPVQRQSVEDQSACRGEAGQSDMAKKKRKCPCVECGNVYGDPSDNKKSEEWLLCPTCPKWLHESCFMEHDC